MNAFATRAIRMYDTVGYDASVEFADQHALVAMLFRALLGSLASAERHLVDGQFLAKGAAISKAQNILHGLHSTLDFERGGEVARNMGDVYDYCMRCLVRAHAKNELAPLREAQKLLGNLESAWQLIPSKQPRHPH